MNPFPEPPMDIGTALFIVACILVSALFWYSVAIFARAYL